MRARKTLTLQYVKRRLSSFSDLSLPANTSSLDLTGNRITSFDGLPALPRLHHLNLNSNPLSSLKGAAPLPSLRWLSFRASPLRSHPYHMLMCVIVFGRHLVTINNSAVPDHISIQCEAFASLAFPRLVAGQLIVSISPLRFSTQSAERPEATRTSLATACARMLSRPVIPRQMATQFRERLARLRGAFVEGHAAEVVEVRPPGDDAVPIVDFEQPDDGADSDASFQGRKLRRVVMPKRAKIRGDYSDEGPRTEFEKQEWSSEYSRSSSTTSFPPSSSS
jgi:hypothetical protein